MASRPTAARSAIVMRAARKAHSAMSWDSVHAMTMLRDELATDAKRTNSTDIRDAWTVQLATIWFKMRLQIIVRNCRHSIEC